MVRRIEDELYHITTHSLLHLVTPPSTLQHNKIYATYSASPPMKFRPKVSRSAGNPMLQSRSPLKSSSSILKPGVKQLVVKSRPSLHANVAEGCEKRAS